MSEGRKRSRKSKLEVRPDDCEYVLVNEENDETTRHHLQKLPKLTLPILEKPRTSQVFDHDYCKPGFQAFAFPDYPPPTEKPKCSFKRSTIIEVQNTVTPSGDIKVTANEVDYECDKNKPQIQFLEKQAFSLINMESNPKTKKREYLQKMKQRLAIKMCKYEPDKLFEVSKEIASNSLNAVDKILDIEMRNLWGNTLYHPHEVDEHENMLQRAVECWQVWLNGSRMVRENPLFYQCHICNLAWWRLQPFRDHIKMHDINSFRIELKENIHECMLVACNKPVNTLKFIDIDEDCWRCGKDLNYHRINHQAYKCSRCDKSQYTCSALRDHESSCLYYSAENFNISKERQCNICKTYITSLDKVKKHMIESHSVRTDLPVPVFCKQCIHCKGKYFTYSNHNCSKSMKNSGCPYCSRKFATKLLALAHTNSNTNRQTMCRICDKWLKSKCFEVEHIVKSHSDNYEMAYRCTICSNQHVLFTDELSIRLHRQVWHQKRSDKRRSYFEMMLVPKRCLQECCVEEPFQTAIDSSSTLPFTEKEDVNTVPDVSAEVNVTGGEVVIKQEITEDGQIDYEQMLHNMFNKSDDDSRQDDSNTVTEEFDFGSVKIKAEPLDDMDITDHPIDNIQVKTEPVDHMEYENFDHIYTQNDMHFEDGENDQDLITEDMDRSNNDKGQSNDDQNRSNNDKGQSNDDQNRSNNDKGQSNDDQNRSNNDKGQSNDEKNRSNNDKGQSNDDQNRSNNDKGQSNDDQNRSNNDKDRSIEDVDQSIKDVHQSNKSHSDKKRSIKDVNPSKKDVDQSEDIKYIVEMCQVKIEPSCSVDEINTETVNIKKEKVDEEQNSSPTIFDDLITDLEMFKSEKVPVNSVNPDEITFDVINPSGLYKRKRVYACQKCGYTAQHKQYILHVNTKCSMSPGNGIYPCSKCGLTFVMFRNYVLHFDAHGYEIMSCPQCGMTFKALVKLLSHVQRHMRANFVGLHLLDKEGESSKTKKKVKCRECHDVVSHDDMFLHWEKHLTLKESPPTPPIEVKEELPELTIDCERVTINNKTLEPSSLKAALDHLQSSSFEKECIICYRVFNRRYDVKRHLIEHLLMDAHMKKTQHKAFRCQICSKDFDHQEKYKFHMRDHGSMPIFKCELCIKTFSDSSNFAKHKKTHNVRVLICDLCSKKFHSKPALVKHLEEHTNPQQTNCAYCDKVFTNKQNYKRHKYQAHVKNKFKCILCDISFTSLQQKWDHNWEIHKERKHAADCPICLKSFRKFHDVRVHARVEHRAEVCVLKQNKEGVQLYKVVDMNVKDETLIVYE